MADRQLADRLGHRLQPHGTWAARMRHLAHGEELCPACQATGSPHVWVDPARQSGKPCIAGTRIPTASAARYVWDGPGVAGALKAWPDVTRGQILVACWYEAVHGSGGTDAGMRLVWARWAELAGEAMWSAEVAYDTIPDPPSREEVAGG